LKKHKIGEIAELAGVSKRTIDYYTNLGLIAPVETTKKCRYYSEETLLRLNLIEDRKKQRFSLEEIKQQLDFIDSNLQNIDEDNKILSNIGYLKEQVKRLEKQLSELQTTIMSSDFKKIPTATAAQGLALVQSLVLSIEKLKSLLHP